MFSIITKKHHITSSGRAEENKLEILIICLVQLFWEQFPRDLLHNVMSMNVRKKPSVVMKNTHREEHIQGFFMSTWKCLISAPFCPSQRCDKPNVSLSPGAKWGTWDDAALIFRSSWKENKQSCFSSVLWKARGGFLEHVKQTGRFAAADSPLFAGP